MVLAEMFNLEMSFLFFPLFTAYSKNSFCNSVMTNDCKSDSHFRFKKEILSSDVRVQHFNLRLSLSGTVSQYAS